MDADMNKFIKRVLATLHIGEDPTRAITRVLLVMKAKPTSSKKIFIQIISLLTDKRPVVFYLCAFVDSVFLTSVDKIKFLNVSLCLTCLENRPNA